MIYGHARVSTERQSADTQVRHTKSTGGCKMLREMASGAKIDCSRGRMVLAQLGAGDMLMVTKLDGLTRSISDLLTLGLEKAGFKSLGCTWTDTTTARAA
jgi:DNA invertase Pin-like site-specific DNA recombinase